MSSELDGLASRLNVAAACALASILFCAHAEADHGNEQPQLTDETAHTVPEGMHKLGLFTVEYGIVDGFQFGTSPPLWIPLFPNASLEWRFFWNDWLALSVEVHGAYLHTRTLQLFIDDLPTADIAVVPSAINSAWLLHEDVTLHFSPRFTWIFVDGQYDRGDFEGAAAVTNLQLTSTLEWRVSSLVALQLRGRYLVFQTATASGGATIQADEFTTVFGRAAAQSNVLDFPHAGQLVAATHLSWETFNLLVGAGFGNNVIPIINLVVQDRGLVPLLDLYWRF